MPMINTGVCGGPSDKLVIRRFHGPQAESSRQPPPTVASAGVTARLNATAETRMEQSASPIRFRTDGRLSRTNANSEPCASRKPSCVEPGTDQRKTRLAAALVRILIIKRPAVTAKISSHA